MTIQYLQKLKNNPSLEIQGSGSFITLQGLSLNEVEQLENLYNNGNEFPLVLKELLLIAGKRCYAFDFGEIGNQVQEKMQEYSRMLMQKNNRTIVRPFYAIDLNVSGEFLFIYLDEGDNPQIYNAAPWEESTEWIELFPNVTIQSIVESKIILIRNGENPY
jgi:hypothetical protein